MLLVSPRDWAIEVEVTADPPFEIRALSPDGAWRIARAWDAQADPPIAVES